VQDEYWLDGVLVSVLTGLGLLFNIICVIHPPRPIHLPRLLAITGTKPNFKASKKNAVYTLPKIRQCRGEPRYIRYFFLSWYSQS
jgi:hypothetical protein